MRLIETNFRVNVKVICVRNKSRTIYEAGRKFLIDHVFEKFQNIFPSANLLAEGKMLGAGRHPTGPEWGG